MRWRAHRLVFHHLADAALMAPHDQDYRAFMTPAACAQKASRSEAALIGGLWPRRTYAAAIRITVLVADRDSCLFIRAIVSGESLGVVVPGRLRRLVCLAGRRFCRA